MKVVGLNDRVYDLNLSKFVVNGNEVQNRSQYHIQARMLLRDIFKGYILLEEVKLPGSRCPSKKSVLFLDFFIHNLMLAIEVHGKQHYEYVPFFHKSKLGYLYAQKRDEIKKAWCDLNHIQLVTLKYSDTPEQWREQIERR